MIPPFELLQRQQDKLVGRAVEGLALGGLAVVEREHLMGTSVGSFAK